MRPIAFNSSNKLKKASLLFYGKRLYHNTLKTQNQKNYLDLWYSKPLYGKVDTNFHVRHLSSRYLKELNSRTLTLGDDRVVKVRDRQIGPNVYALNFVADAFNAMAAYLRELELKGKLNKNVFFHPLVAYKGWQKTNKMYRDHSRILYDLFVNKYMLSNRARLNRQVTSYDDYVPLFNDYLNFTINQRVPFTKSGFMLNLDCPHSVSGLVIEIAKESDASDDRNKYFTYFRKRRQMSIYVETAAKFGFYVDMNMPWRLVANLESPAWEQNPILKEIVDKYFPEGYNVQKVFDNYYHKSYESDVPSLKVFTMQYYNSLVRKRPSFQMPRVCPSVGGAGRTYYSAGKVRRKTIRRQQIRMDQLDKRYDDLFWLRAYMQIRLKEMQIDISEHQIRHELREIEQTYASMGYDDALDHVAQRTSFYLQEQLGKFLALQRKGKNLLINSQTPDIIF